MTMLTVVEESRKETRMPHELMGVDGCKDALVQSCHRRLGNPLKFLVNASRTHSGAGFVKATGVCPDSPVCGNQAQSSFHYGFCAYCQPVRARKLMGQKSPAPRKDSRSRKTNWFVSALVEGLKQACLIGDRPQSRHPDESTRQAHLVCGVSEVPRRWRVNQARVTRGSYAQIDLQSLLGYHRSST